MANKKEVKQHIAGISDIKTITNAMYLIASTKLRRAKADLKNIRDCFTALNAAVDRLARDKRTGKNVFFRSAKEKKPGIVVITADKGLAGSYNYNVIRKVSALLKEMPDAKLYVVGNYGRQYFLKHKAAVEESFVFSPESYVLRSSRAISVFLTDKFRKGELTEIYVVYTGFSGGMETTVRAEKLLPLDKEKTEKGEFEYFPSVEEVCNLIVPEYLTGYLCGAITNGFYSEQNARMTAMDSANKNAEKLLEELSVKYDHIRQNSITQEMIEVSAGVTRQRQKETEK